MTAFDPKLAREILMRRHRRLENAGTAKGGQVYSLLWAGGKYLAPTAIRQLEDERDALYKQADSTREVIWWLDARIEEEKQVHEKIWDLIESRPYDPEDFGPQMVKDVLLAGVELDLVTISR